MSGYFVSVFPEPQMPVESARLVVVLVETMTIDWQRVSWLFVLESCVSHIAAESDDLFHESR